MLDNGWQVGLLICYESEFPEAMRQCALDGADLVLVPTALGIDWPIVSRCVIPSRAFENNVFLAYANYMGRDASNNYLGDSVIVAPTGQDLARADEKNCWIEAQLDRQLIGRSRARLNYLKDYRELV